MPCASDNFNLNYGWEHFWYDPGKNVFPKEYVKGPFLSPKLACPYPYISLCQTEGEPLKVRTGIPDCWGDYLIHQLGGDYDSMHKEDVDVAHQLRKNYRIYLGQGIPNPSNTPYTSTPGAPRCKGLKENLKKYLLQISESKNKNKKGNCLCCEKNYLLECPDKSNPKNRNCTCKTCHSKGIDYEDQCRCIEILQNWVSEDIHLKERQRKGNKKNQAKLCQCSSESSGCETDDEETNVSSGKTCQCPKNIRLAFDSISSANSNISCIERQSKHEEYIFGKDFLYKGFTEKKGGFGFFPYSGNIYRGKKSLRFKDAKATSKQIQTENRLIGDTKTVQTENAESKIQTSNKCFRCTMYQYQFQHSGCKLNPCENSMFISPGIIKNHAIICPYTCHEHLLDQKPHWVNSLERRRKKKKGILQEENSGDHQKHSKEEEEDDILNANKKNNFKIYEAFKPADLSKINKTTDYRQPYLKSFDSLKYLTDSRLKNYLLERETLRTFCNKTSQTLNETTKLPSIAHGKPSPCQKTEKYKFPNVSSSFYAGSPTKADKMRPKHADRGVATGVGEEPPKKEVITKYFKNVDESDESRTYGLVRSCGSNRKHRKLVSSKKRRKTGGRKKLENRMSKAVGKKAEIEPRERPRLDFGDDKETSKFVECKQFDDGLKKAEQKSLLEIFKRPLCHEHYQKISSSRSPDIMKFIVGDLIIDEKSKT